MHDGRILLRGGTGYIGGRLLRVLEEGGSAVRCLARQPERVITPGPDTEVVSGDCLDEGSLDAAMHGIDHSMVLRSGRGGLQDDKPAGCDCSPREPRRVVILVSLWICPPSMAVEGTGRRRSRR